jgi:O-antigen/teichoic acid export membrane protein
VPGWPLRYIKNLSTVQRRISRVAISVGIVDQAVSSLSNFTLTLAVARVGSRRDFGVFAVVSLGYTVALVVSRSGIGQPVLIRTRSDGGTVPGMAAAVAAVSTVGMGICLAYGAILGQFTLAFLFVCTIPLLLLQDVLRYVGIAQGHASDALMSDSVWLLGLLTSLVGLSQFQHLGVLDVCGLWVAWGIIGALFLLLRLPRLQSAWSLTKFWQCVGSLSVPLVLDTAGIVLVLQIDVAVAGAIGGLSLISGIRAAQALLSPVNTLVGMVSLVLIPAVRDWDRRGLHVLRRNVSVVAGGCVALVSGIIAVLGSLSTTFGHAILGATWEPGRHFLVPVGASVAGAAVAYVLTVVLRVREHGRLLLKGRLVAGAIEPCGLAVGGVCLGSIGAAWGLAVGQAVALAVWVRALLLSES